MQGICDKINVAYIIAINVLIADSEIQKGRIRGKMNFSEKTFVNRTALIGHTIIDSILVLAYVIELLKGSRTLAYFILFALLCIVPVVAEYLVYFKNKESKAIKHMICCTYGLLYMFVIFTTNSRLPFTYAFPMYMVVILFMDVKCSALIAVAAFLGNVIFVTYEFFTVGYTSEELPDLEIRVICMALTGLYMVLVCMAVRKVNMEKLKQIQEHTDAAKAMTENILRTSDSMIAGISEATDKVEKLGESVVQIRDSMNEVSVGSTETAESIQVQMQRTEQIQEHIVLVKNTAAQIEQNMQETTKRVEDGKAQMEVLALQVEKSMSANGQVLERMRALNEYTSQMNTIIETITSIANSTGMLALNASIEAARAGEAGRGFAVVAGQISALANQTKEATVNITELIRNINKELVSVETAVDVVTQSNQANSECTQTVSDNFAGINHGTDNVNQKTQELMEIVHKLEAANSDIVDNIQTISAITEEVSAHAGETYNACEGNTVLVSAVTEIVGNLNSQAQKLQGTK